MLPPSPALLCSVLPQLSNTPHLTSHNSQDEINKELCSLTGQQKLQVQRYLWNRRRDSINEKKVVKFSEALWRAIFYSCFLVIGAYTLLIPEVAPWILDTNENWRNWPHHSVSPMMDLYVQLELGCYLHQLYWTEVSRSDAVEMILHHLITITLISTAYMCNFLRFGSTILIVHDTADIFLEYGKCLNYTSKVPEFKPWASKATDVFFALFAVSFFISRLVIYPRYVLYSLWVEAPSFYGMWFGFWPNIILLGTLQLLHIFWFYMILKMAYKIAVVGEVEKDVRSDDEGEEEEPELVSTGACQPTPAALATYEKDGDKKDN
jgi:hypothetical protein